MSGLAADVSPGSGDGADGSGGSEGKDGRGSSGTGSLPAGAETSAATSTMGIAWSEARAFWFETPCLGGSLLRSRSPVQTATPPKVRHKMQASAHHLFHAMSSPP
jgi:hypothetical protein